MSISPNIYDFVKSEEGKYETSQIQVGDNWMWNMRDHIQLIFHLKNGQFLTGENDYIRAFKNIMQPILELAYWTEDIEVKDVVFYIESEEGKALSFLIKKYHDEVYVKEHDLDTLFDDISESDIDFGGVLVQKGEERPELLPLISLAFADQTDIMGSPFAFKHNFSPDKLKSMSKFGWGDKKNGATITIDELITLSNNEKETTETLNIKENKVAGKQIEIYIIRGDMPEHYLKDNDNMDDYSNQLQIIAYYTKEDSTKEGVTLFRNNADIDDVLFHTSKIVENRALGQGEGEKILHDQIWTNFLEIHKMGMLESGAKTPLVTDDPSYTQKNKIQNMENLEITTIEEGKRIDLIPTISPVNVQLYEDAINELFSHAQLAGSAQDPILGVEGKSGTTFRGQERTVAQGRGSHDRRRGKRAKFIEKIYRTWIIPDIVKEITKGKEFMATLSVEELTWVADQVSTNKVNKKIKEKLMKGEVVTPEEQVALTEVSKQAFLKTGSKHLLETVKGEFKGIEVKMGINIAGKQKNLADLSDKVLSIFELAFSNPQQFQIALQNPGLAKAFSDILEFSGMSMGDFSGFLNAPPVANPEQQQPQQPSEGLDGLLQKQEEQLA